MIIEKESLIPKESFTKSPEQYGIDLTSIVQHFKMMDVFNGKLVVKKSLRRLSKAFDFFFNIVILISVILLCYDVPYNDPFSTESMCLKAIDITITFIFLIEAVLKLIAKGAFHNNYMGIRPYFFNLWDIIDLLVLTISLMQVYIYMTESSNDSETLKSIKVLRVIRAIRPLRIFNKHNELKSIMNAFIESFPVVSNFWIATLLVGNILNMLGLTLFRGKFYSCQNYDSNAEGLIHTRWDCLNYGGEWINSAANYDTYTHSFKSSLQVSSSEGWMDLMNIGIDSVGIDKQPIYNYNESIGILFVIEVLLMQFFLYNILVAIVIDYFHQSLVSNRIGDGNVFTKMQLQWLEIHNQWLQKKLPKKQVIPKWGCIAFLYNISTSKMFDIWSLLMILCHSIIISTITVGMSDEEFDTIIKWSIVYVYLWNFEIWFRFITNLHNLRAVSTWHKFDIIWLIAADTCLILYYQDIQFKGQLLIIALRSFKLLTVFNIIKNSNTLMSVVYREFSKINTLFIVFAIFLIILSIIGMNMFSMKMYRSTYNELNNFNTFLESYLLTFVLSIEDQRYDILNDIASRDRFNDKQCINNETWEMYQTYGPIE